MTGGLVDEDDSSFITSFNFKDVSEEIKSIIFDSYASLDDHNVDDCFGLDLETAMKASMNTSSSFSTSWKHPSLPKVHEAYTSFENQSPYCAPLTQATTPSATNDIVSPNDSSDNSVASSNEEDATKPKRPLSAYNLFFQLERERIIDGIDDMPFTADDVERVAIARRISDMQPEKPKRKHRKTHGKITFAELARAIANRWRGLAKDQKDLLLERAASEKKRFLKELEEWNKKNSSVDNWDQDLAANRPEDSSPEFFGNALAMQRLTVPGSNPTCDDLLNGTRSVASQSNDVHGMAYEMKDAVFLSSSATQVDDYLCRDKGVQACCRVRSSNNRRFLPRTIGSTDDITSLNAVFARNYQALFDIQDKKDKDRMLLPSAVSSHYYRSVPTNPSNCVFLNQPDDRISFDQLHDFAFGKENDITDYEDTNDYVNFTKMTHNVKYRNESMNELLFPNGDYFDANQFNATNEKISNLLLSSSIHCGTRGQPTNFNKHCQRM